ncbi:hypothetical protein QEG73_14300 [Chitinophagaceae bacterium 26-R-25]|nr:hypothetical protein [Chitinophagaceae bacterium 26-R-25]
MKPGLACIMLFFTLNTYSQVTIRNASLIKPDTNALVFKKENYLHVVGTSSKVNLTSRAGNLITDEGNNTFKIEVNSQKPDTLLVFANKKLLLKKSFFIDTPSGIKVQVGNIANDTATVAEILANRGLKVTSNSLYNLPVTIYSFGTTFITPSLDTLAKNLRTEGYFFSAEQQRFIKGLSKHSKIILEDIRLVAQDGRLRSIGPYFIYIK